MVDRNINQVALCQALVLRLFLACMSIDSLSSPAQLFARNHNQSTVSAVYLRTLLKSSETV